MLGAKERNDLGRSKGLVVKKVLTRNLDVKYYEESKVWRRQAGAGCRRGHIMRQLYPQLCCTRIGADPILPMKTRDGGDGPEWRVVFVDISVQSCCGWVDGSSSGELGAPVGPKTSRRQRSARPFP